MYIIPNLFHEKKARSNNSLKPKAHLQWVFMDIIPSTAPNSFKSETKLSNYILIVDAYSKIPRIYGIKKIATEEVVDELDMLQSRFGKINEFGWWYLERISADAARQFTSREFKEE